MLRQGCCTRWTSHLTQHIHLHSRNHNSKLLESIKIIPALCGCDCLDRMVWEFPVQLLRVPDTHTPHWWLWPLSPRETSQEMQWPCRHEAQKETRLLCQALSSPISTAIYRAMHWFLTFCIPFQANSWQQWLGLAFLSDFVFTPPWKLGTVKNKVWGYAVRLGARCLSCRMLRSIFTRKVSWRHLYLSIPMSRSVLL